MINRISTNTTGSYCLSKKVTCVISRRLYYSMCTKCPSPAQTQVRRCWCHSPTACSMTAWLRAAHSLLMRRFSSSTSEILIDSFLKHTPHSVVNWVEVRWVRQPESGWDKIGRLLIQQHYCVFGAMWWGTVLLKNEKLTSRCCTNVRKQHLSQNNVTIIRPIVIDFDSWYEDENVTGTETGHCYEDHHGLAKIWPGF